MNRVSFVLLEVNSMLTGGVFAAARDIEWPEWRIKTSNYRHTIQISRPRRIETESASIANRAN